MTPNVLVIYFVLYLALKTESTAVHQLVRLYIYKLLIIKEMSAVFLEFTKMSNKPNLN